MKEQPSYYAIIPANIRYDSNLKPNEKLLYGEITALASKNGYCWASNKYFSQLYEVKVETISRWIRNLKEKGYINVTLVYKDDSKQIEKRVIRINATPYPIDEKINRGIDKKVMRGIDEKVKGNNTSVNNTSNNILSSSDELDRVPYKEIVDYLNNKTGKNYKPNTKKTQSLIKARVNEGFNLNDFKQVIDTKVDEWGNDREMSKFLRPETLFGTKFEGYLNQHSSKPQRVTTTVPTADRLNSIQELLKGENE